MVLFESSTIVSTVAAVCVRTVDHEKISTTFCHEQPPQEDATPPTPVTNAWLVEVGAAVIVEEFPYCLSDICQSGR